MGEQPFLGTAFIFVAVMTLALIRLGHGQGGRRWAVGWICLWVAGGTAAFSQQVPALGPLSPMLGTVFSLSLYTGTLRFLGRGVPRWVIGLGAAVAVVRMATFPFVSEAVLQASGALVISTGALASSFALARTPGASRSRLLAVTFPLAAAAACVYAYMEVAATPPWIPIFIWLVAGILLSGTQVLSLVQRIADRAEAERAVLASLFDAVPLGLALFDGRGSLRAANHTFQKIAGMALSPAAGVRSEAEVQESLSEQLDPGTGEPALGPDSRPSGFGAELHFRSGLRIVQAIHAVAGADGETIGRLWLLRDITEEQRLQESLERAQRLETLGGFAGGVAHDFNNQLTSVLGNTMLLRESLRQDHASQEILEDLQASAEYCARLTRDVLDFARRGSGTPAEVDLEHQLASFVTRLAREGAAVRLVVAPGTPPVRIDPTQLERAVENLVDNARYAAGPEGSVEIHAYRSSEKPGRVVLEVRDDGPGIEERMRARIFDPFYTTKPVGRGSGLGLAIVYGIVTQQGGEVRVESPPGQGTRMITTWPVARSD